MWADPLIWTIIGGLAPDSNSRHRRYTMPRFTRSTRGGLLAGIVLSIGIALLKPIPLHAGADEDYTKLPGYVDFGPALGEMEASVEVYLKGSLLVLAREAVKENDPELGELLSKIDYIHVHVFPMDGASSRKLNDTARQVEKQLEKKGWELTVRAREKGENVHVYLLPGKKDDIAGLVVMAMEEDDEAVFINVVGNINPAEIGRIGRSFHIKSMDVPVQVEVKGDAKVTVKEGEKSGSKTE
jgi:hypothetical protein